MHGTVKWFSSEKGYGFITSEDGDDHYFNVQSINGPTLTSNGDSVSFESKTGNKGLRAFNVKITERATKNHLPDDRINCPHCSRKIIPRIITRKGQPYKSICPYCGNIIDHLRACVSCGKIVPWVRRPGHRRGWTMSMESPCPYCSFSHGPWEKPDPNACFIATAVYGDQFCNQLVELRIFRDRVLLNNAAGRLFVEYYYKVSPPIAAWLINRPTLSRQIRFLLDILVKNIEKKNRGRTTIDR